MENESNKCVRSPQVNFEGAINNGILREVCTDEGGTIVYIC